MNYDHDNRLLGVRHALPPGTIQGNRLFCRPLRTIYRGLSWMRPQSAGVASMRAGVSANRRTARATIVSRIHARGGVGRYGESNLGYMGSRL